MQTIQISGIDPAPFEHLFELDDDELARMNILRPTADAPTGFPCRVSPANAAVGDEFVLLNYAHHPVN